MKRKSLFLFPSIIAMSLTACANVRHEISEYILELNYSNDYRILQLSDTHIGDKDNTQLHYDFMDLTIKEANPDLIVITGDVFTFASKATAKEFFKFMDSHGVPWTLTLGNHDEQCYFSVDWLTRTLNEYGSHCVFKDIQDDDVQGNANFAINLMVGDVLFEQLIVMDSNRYDFKTMYYDYFKPNQIQWYKDMVEYGRSLPGGALAKSLMFYHIPLPETQKVWDMLQEGSAEVTNVPFKVKGEDKYGTLEEDVCCPDYNSGFFQVIDDLDYTTGMYFGHDHVNNFIINYKGIDFAYGVKATDRVYYGESKLGGRVITLHADHTTSYEDYYHTYAEVK